MADDHRLEALSEEIGRVRHETERSAPPPPQPTDLERLALREVAKVLDLGEAIAAHGLAYFGRADEAALLVFMLTTLVAPIAGLLGLAAARHWWVVATDRRLLVFRLFEEQRTFPDSGMALERSGLFGDLTIDKAKVGSLGARLNVRIGGESYRFRFPTHPTSGPAVVICVAAKG